MDVLGRTGSRKITENITQHSLLDIFILLLLPFGLISCSQTIEPDQLLKHISKSTTENQIIDLREPEKYADGHIENAVNIVWNHKKFKKKLARFSKDKTTIIYCNKGEKGKKILKLMRSSGFKDVLLLNGGFENWLKQKFPIVKSFSNKSKDNGKKS